MREDAVDGGVGAAGAAPAQEHGERLEAVAAATFWGEGVTGLPTWRWDTMRALPPTWTATTWST